MIVMLSLEGTMTLTILSKSVIEFSKDKLKSGIRLVYLVCCQKSCSNENNLILKTRRTRLPLVMKLFWDCCWFCLSVVTEFDAYVEWSYASQTFVSFVEPTNFKQIWAGLAAQAKFLFYILLLLFYVRLFGQPQKPFLNTILSWDLANITISRTGLLKWRLFEHLSVLRSLLLPKDSWCLTKLYLFSVLSHSFLNFLVLSG